MTRGPLTVVGLGGNALSPRGEAIDVANQRQHMAAAADALARLAERGGLVVTHGNGPQVGLMAVEQSEARHGGTDPLDVLDAATEGTLGYLVEQGLVNALHDRCPVVSVLTMVEVDAEDPAFHDPVKPVGATYARADAEALAASFGWQIVEVAGGWRRVVPSPEPRRIVERDAIATLVANGFVVVCAGGGGIPVVRDAHGLRGVEAVIDKDLATALLAVELAADGLALLTDVDGVIDAFGTPDARPLVSLTVAEARALALPRGSMGAKVEAAARFVEATGHTASIGALQRTVDVVNGTSGTRIVA